MGQLDNKTAVVPGSTSRRAPSRRYKLFTLGGQRPTVSYSWRSCRLWRFPPIRFQSPPLA